MGKPGSRIIGGETSLPLLIRWLRRLKVLLLVLLILSLLALVLLLIRAVAKIPACRTIATRILHLTGTIILRDLAALVWENRLGKGRRGSWKDTFVGRRVITLVVVPSNSKVQMQTIVRVHDGEEWVKTFLLELVDPRPVWLQEVDLRKERHERTGALYG